MKDKDGLGVSKNLLLGNENCHGSPSATQRVKCQLRMEAVASVHRLTKTLRVCGDHLPQVELVTHHLVLKYYYSDAAMTYRKHTKKRKCAKQKHHHCDKIPYSWQSNYTLATSSILPRTLNNVARQKVEGTSLLVKIVKSPTGRWKTYVDGPQSSRSVGRSQCTLLDLAAPITKAAMTMSVT